MKSVEEIAAEIVMREGGYVDDPDDPGGATNMGVTIGTLRRLGYDLDGDGRITTADLRRLSRAQATDIFIEHYYKRPRIDALPERLRASAFDMYVNSGANAVKILQHLLVAMRIPVAIDGIIGPQTVAAAARAQAAAPDHLADAYGIARRNYYYNLADRRPASRKYARRRDGGKGGWITRAESFISPKYRLTEAQHRKRVAAWG
ncbi:MAG: lysozyme family protein [Limimaricola cinnabarinus]|jgi:lysozyme family protein|uniref:holin-associated N-acetylmuramidase n=1 Tax=Limimaricola cinnabarinus TaxID=1125964 RepID=UPI0039E256CD